MTQISDDTDLLALHLSVPEEDLRAHLPGPWRKATAWRPGLTGAVFVGGAEGTVALRTVSVPSGTLVLDVDDALGQGLTPEEIEPVLRWIEVGRPIAPIAGEGAGEWSLREPVRRVGTLGTRADLLAQLAAAVSEEAHSEAGPPRPAD